MTRVEVLSEATLSDANRINNEFMGTTGKHCCGCCSYAWCPDSDSEFASNYRKRPEQMNLTAVAVGKDDTVIGVLKLSVYGVQRNFFEAGLHTIDPGEAYVEWVAVTKNARGQGAGSLLMQWAETTARERGATTITLGVVSGNPAQKLYERIGYASVKQSARDQMVTNCLICCMFGSPNGMCGGIMMEKTLT
eukprot:CAMPEP_0204871730 /NCGR_PEP_ID=MMETSP1348-20121228/36380_1 /ASSEMBLY_ACC=CAM_ASM_000700 /TAXON_ID=215587 /ORGANISM="Aplanochytrium stocchinoi, Strain GSBS06" /LENGTH=191 /DNA_ID=CAMNT_0052026217 /DNA_START=160 /DNA_END=735 /DNA_ORIENTATION=-